MKRISHLSVAGIVAALVVTSQVAVTFAAGPEVTTPDGRPVVWTDWLEEHGPVAVLFWASWVPEADATLDTLGTIAAAARKRDLDVILVVVQESLGEAQKALEGTEIRWLHDRYGHLLKSNRVVSIPRILVISGDGTVIEQLDVKPESIRAWGGG